MIWNKQKRVQKPEDVKPAIKEMWGSVTINLILSNKMRL